MAEHFRLAVFSIQIIVLVSLAMVVCGDVSITVPRSLTSNVLITISFSEEMFEGFHECLCNGTANTCKVKYNLDHEAGSISSEPQSSTFNETSKIYTCRSSPGGIGGTLACDRLDNYECLPEQNYTFFRLLNVPSCQSVCTGILWSKFQSMQFQNATYPELCAGHCGEPAGHSSSFPTTLESTEQTSIATNISTSVTTTIFSPPPDKTSTADSNTAKTTSAKPTAVTSQQSVKLPDSTTEQETSVPSPASCPTSAASRDEDDEDDKLPIIIGIICGVVGLLLIILIVVFIVRGRRKRASKRLTVLEEVSGNNLRAPGGDNTSTPGLGAINHGFNNSSLSRDNTTDENIDQLYAKVNKGNRSVPSNGNTGSAVKGKALTWENEAPNGLSTVTSPQWDKSAVVASDKSNDKDQNMDTYNIYNTTVDDVYAPADHTFSHALSGGGYPLSTSGKDKSNTAQTRFSGDYATFDDIDVAVSAKDKNVPPVPESTIRDINNSDADNTVPGLTIEDGGKSEGDETPVYAVVNKSRNKSGDLMITVL